MSVVVTERDEDHKSRESLALGRRCWDVRQQDLLVGVFYSEEEANAYRDRLVSEEAQRHAQAAEHF